MLLFVYSACTVVCVGLFVYTAYRCSYFVLLLLLLCVLLPEMVNKDKYKMY